MKYEEFTGEVQSRARLGSQGDTVQIIRATLEPFGKRFGEDSAENLAAQLPEEIGRYLLQGDAERFTLEEFYDRVTEETGADRPDAIFQARMVMSVVRDSISEGQWEDVQAAFPDEFDELFDVEDAEAVKDPEQQEEQEE